jgi:hypothetical protein
MKKLDIKEHIQTKAIADSIKGLCMIFDEETPPSIKELASYKTLVEYFQNAHYSIKVTSHKSEFNIKHKKYSTVKFIKDKNNSFSRFEIKYNGDSLEAKILLDVPVLNKEIKVIATRTKQNNYICTSLSYNNNIIYTRFENK